MFTCVHVTRKFAVCSTDHAACWIYVNCKYIWPAWWTLRKFLELYHNYIIASRFISFELSALGTDFSWSFVLRWLVIIYRLGGDRDRRDFFALLRGSRWRSACFRIDGQRGSFVRLLASITEITAESLTVTDDIQGDPVSHRTRLNQPQVAACSATIIDWLSMYGLTNIYRLIGNARHLVLAATRAPVPRLLSIDPFII